MILYQGHGKQASKMPRAINKLNRKQLEAIKQKLSFILSRVALLILISTTPAHSWFDTNAQGVAPEWHYRVPINIPATAPTNSTVKFDVDFNALLATLGVGGTFDINSPRIVRPNESLASTQEYTDSIYNDVLDLAANARGEVKFILQDAGPATYYLYFDTTVNGVKPANPNPTINGNFEHSVGLTPTNWDTPSTGSAGAENNEVHDTPFGSTFSSGLTCGGDQAINNADTSPNNTGGAASTTGRKWHLNGYRDRCEDGAGTRENINLSKTFTVPSVNPGNLTFYFQLQAFDSWNGATQYDYFKVLVNGVLVDHTTLGIANLGNELLIVNGGIGRNNNFSSTLLDAGWRQATLDLNAFANTNITLQFTTDFFGADNAFRTWVKLDDIEWSIRSATLGTPEAIPPVITLQKSSQVVSDAFNGITNPKRIPGAVVEYTILVTNSGYGITDNNSIVINDAIPANTDFIINSVQFIDGALSSGLTATSANFSYSTDGTTYNAAQSSVTSHIRVSPQGQFSAASGAGNPTFQVKFQIEVN